MVLLITLFAMFGVALAAGWGAQLLAGRGGRIDWTQAGWVGLVGTTIAGLIAWAVDGAFGAVFSVAGLVLAIGISFAIESVLVGRERRERREERQRRAQLTPEGLPGHHQPQRRSKKRKRH
jgi:hypothetical protein